MKMIPAASARSIARAALAAALLMASQPAAAERPRVYAITGARVVAAPGRVLEGATVILRDGLIEAVGRDLKVPADAFVIEGKDRTLTAGFIDACSEIGQKRAEGGGEGPAGRAAPREAPAGTPHPLAKVRPEKRVTDLLAPDAAAFEKHRALGFAAALTLPSEGIFRGQPALITLGDGAASSLVLVASAGQAIAFETGGFGRDYPGSLMGAIAAIRQVFYDAQRQALWEARYRESPNAMPRPDHLPAFDALAEAAAGRSPVLFDVRDSANVERALAIAREFSLRAIVIGSGEENAEPGAIAALRQAGVPVVLPLAYPDKPKVDDPDEALDVSLDQLERWDRAPANPAAVRDAGILMALGTCRLDSAGDFPARLRKALARGLTADAALAALTSDAARLLGVEATLGTIEPGKIANLALFEGAPADGETVFAEKARVANLFIDGVKYDIEKRKSRGDPNAKADPRGTWSIQFTVAGRTMSRTWVIKGTPGDWSGTAETQRGVVSFSSIKLEGNEMTLVMPADGNRPSQELIVVITGDSLAGSGEFGSGTTYTIEGTRTGPPEGGAL